MECQFKSDRPDQVVKIMKFCFISDTHNKVHSVKLEAADVLIHSGDALLKGTYRELVKFNKDLGKIKHLFKHIIYVPGNHDIVMQDDPKIGRETMSNATVLIDQSIEIEGYKVYGSPWTTYFYDWAFNLPERESNERLGEGFGPRPAAEACWAMIPDDTQILVTHGPPHMMLDQVGFSVKSPHVGCPELAKRIEQLHDLKIHAFGHIHTAAGQFKGDKVHFINASICNEKYKPYNAPIVVDLPDAGVPA